MRDTSNRLPLVAVLAACLTGGAQSPVPTVTVEPPLKEIGRVRVTTPFCKAALTHALTGISLLLENDVRIGEAVQTMRQIDANATVLARSSRWQELNHEYAALRANAISARAAIRALKSAAPNAPTRDQAINIVALANAIDGALARQNKVGDEVGRLAQYIDNHQPADEASSDRTQFEAIIAPPDSRARLMLAQPSVFASKVPLSAVASKEADDVEERARGVSGDEDTAATRIDAAFSGC